MSEADEARTLEWLRELKRARGDELRRRHGAHALGIGRNRRGEVALLFYVEPGSGPRPGVEPVPECVEFVPEGSSELLCLPTEVVETEQAAPESAE